MNFAWTSELHDVSIITDIPWLFTTLEGIYLAVLAKKQ